MDPSYWQMDPGMSPPPAYDDLSIAMEPDESLAIEAPQNEEEFDEDEDILEGEKDIEEANEILDNLNLPNYDDVQMRLEQPEMTATKKRNYLKKVVNDADSTRKKLTVEKSNATIKYNAGKISADERDRIHNNSNIYRLEVNEYINYYKNIAKTIQGSGIKRQKGRGINGAGVLFYHDAKELREKLTLIIGEMEAGNTSIQMRNTCQSILDALLKSKSINKGQYQKLV